MRGRTMRKKTAFSRSSGVSETVGFILIFGIVMSGIALVTLYGYPALMDAQQNANIRNMQKNMFVLQSDLRSLTAKGVPYQETMIQVSGGTLSVLETPNQPSPCITITTNIPGIDPIVHYPGELKFTSADGSANIALENGAVHIRYWNDLTGSAMLANPPWFYDPLTKTYVIHLIQINGTSNFGQSGVGTVRMQLDESAPPSTEVYLINNPNQATFSYRANPTEDYRIAWKNYLASPELEMTLIDVTWPNVVYGFSPSAKTLIIKRYNVTVLSL